MNHKLNIMEEEYNYPGNDRDEKKWDKEAEIGVTPGVGTTDEHSLEHDGPNNTKPFNVLHQDGSFADYADHTESTTKRDDAQEGTLGLGT